MENEGKPVEHATAYDSVTAPATNGQNTANTSKPIASAEKKAEADQPTSAAASTPAQETKEKESGPCGLPKGCVIL